MFGGSQMLMAVSVNSGNDGYGWQDMSVISGGAALAAANCPLASGLGLPPEDKPCDEAKACSGWRGRRGGGWEMPGSIAGEMIETSGPNICRAKGDLSGNRNDCAAG